MPKPGGIVDAAADEAIELARKIPFSRLPLRRARIPSRAESGRLALLGEEHARRLQAGLLDVDAADRNRDGGVVTGDEPVDRLILQRIGGAEGMRGCDTARQQDQQANDGHSLYAQTKRTPES